MAMDKRLSVFVAILALVYFCYFKDDFDQDSIKGKRVLITGASSGIGEQLAYQYSRLGARVMIASRRGPLLEKVAKRCQELGAQQVEFVIADLAIQDSRDEVIAAVKARFAGLDHLLLNHAVLAPRLWSFPQGNMTVFRNELEINFFSFVDLASQSLPLLVESNGSIGVVSSIAGKIAFPAIASYSTSKFQIIAFFTALRQELRYMNDGVSVTVCVLGAVDTDIIKYTEAKKLELLEKTWGYEVRACPKSTAAAIMAGVTNRKYEIYYPASAFWTAAVHHLFPGYVEDMLGRVFLSLGLHSMA